MQKFPDSALEVTLSFTRKTSQSEWEDFHHSFTSNDSLEPILEKLEMFLGHLGFVLDGRQLVLQDNCPDNPHAVDQEVLMEYVMDDNVRPFPKPPKLE
jgi:hypothetical protein